MLTSDSFLIPATDENKENLLALLAKVEPRGSTNFEEVGDPAVGAGGYKPRFMRFDRKLHSGVVGTDQCCWIPWYVSRRARRSVPSTEGGRSRAPLHVSKPPILIRSVCRYETRRSW